MPSFEEEAFARAQQMNKRQPFHSNNHQNQKSAPKQEQPSKKDQREQNSVPENLPEQKTQNNSLFDMLFKNKEQSLILLMLVLLMDEKTDPVLLLALVYLLI